MVAGLVNNQQYQLIMVFQGQLVQKYRHIQSIALSKNVYKHLAVSRRYCAVHRPILTYSLTGYRWAALRGTPTIGWFTYATKTCFILKHELNTFVFQVLVSLVAPIFFQQELLEFFVNFFEEAISSSLALPGCLGRGCTFRHPCRLEAYIWLTCCLLCP